LRPRTCCPSSLLVARKQPEGCTPARTEWLRFPVQRGASIRVRATVLTPCPIQTNRPLTGRTLHRGSSHPPVEVAVTQVDFVDSIQHRILGEIRLFDQQLTQSPTDEAQFLNLSSQLHILRGVRIVRLSPFAVGLLSSLPRLMGLYPLGIVRTIIFIFVIKKKTKHAVSLLVKTAELPIESDDLIQRRVEFGFGTAILTFRSTCPDGPVARGTLCRSGLHFPIEAAVPQVDFVNHVQKRIFCQSGFIDECLAKSPTDQPEFVDLLLKLADSVSGVRRGGTQGGATPVHFPRKAPSFHDKID